MKPAFIGFITAALLTVVATILIGGLMLYQKYSTEEYVRDYYDALIKGDYKGAAEHLHPWEDNPDNMIKLSGEQAQSMMVKKMSELKSRNYSISKIKDIRVKTAGSRLGAEVELEVVFNGKLENIKEEVFYYGTKVVVTKSNDPYAMYRNGKITR